MANAFESARMTSLAAHGAVRPSVDELITLSRRGLPRMYRPQRREFVQTLRRDPHAPSWLHAEGVNLRYAAIVALGAAHLPLAQQQELLAGDTATELAATVAERAMDATDPGAVALGAWVAAEVRDEPEGAVFGRLASLVKAATPVPTVDYAWALTALVAASKMGHYATLAEQAAERLLAAQAPSGVFPHVLPPETLGRFRAHVGCFADQVYPIQALSRYAAATGDRRALDAADRCAAQIVELQGPAGQWWWHYDTRTGDVVEGYPVYSVHQHAMAPMALFDLADAGGTDHIAAIASGLAWLGDHPESTGELIDPDAGVVWRKIGRREPPKAVRTIRAVSTSVRPGLRLSALDRVFAPGPIDYECRPYELGWLLYAWLRP